MSRRAPTIGVIIPTLNEECALPETLRSLQPFRFDEIIIADGGSQDRTMKLARAFQASGSPRSMSVIAAPRGRARQMNAGAAKARTDVLLFLHADTRLPAEAQSRIEGALADSRCVGGRFDVRFEHDAGYAWLISRMMNLRSRWSGISTGDQALFVRREVFERLGGFADIPLMEDIEFSARLKQEGDVQALRSKVTTSFRRWEQDGPVRTILRMWSLRFLYWLGVAPQTLQRFYANIR